MEYDIQLKKLGFVYELGTIIKRIMKTYISNITVEWVHCDPAGIVFYPHFYTWFDQATERLFCDNGLSYPELKKKYQLVGMPLVETGAAYKKACRHEDRLEIHSFIEEWAKKTFLVRHKIQHADGVEALSGFERRVWALKDPSSEVGMRAGEIPEDIRQLFDE
jgi:4-hydroxybenzoyl-CoA thioesterase